MLEKLRELRIKKGLSQKQLGEILNVAQNTVSNWEKNTREPDSDMLVKIADYFNVSTDTLINRAKSTEAAELYSYLMSTGLSPEESTKALPKVIALVRDGMSRTRKYQQLASKEDAILHGIATNFLKKHRLIGETVKNLRVVRGISQHQLARKAGISSRYLKELESGKKHKPPFMILNSLADSLGIELEDLIGDVDKWLTQHDNDIDFDEVHCDTQIVPIYNKIINIPNWSSSSFGNNFLNFHNDNIIEYEMLLNDQIDTSETNDEYENFFGLRVIDDSMNNSRMENNDTVIIYATIELNNGDIGIVLVEGENAIIRRYYKKDSIITLLPNSSNSIHQPRIIDSTKTKVIVLGKVVKIIIKL